MSGNLTFQITTTKNNITVFVAKFDKKGIYFESVQTTNMNDISLTYGTETNNNNYYELKPFSSTYSNLFDTDTARTAKNTMGVNVYYIVNPAASIKYTFKGNLYSNNLADGYTYYPFIDVFKPEYRDRKPTVGTISINGSFSVEVDLSLSNYTGYNIVQYGFTITGPTVNGTTDKGSIKIYNFGQCFKEGTKILTNNGYIPIENLKKNDLIKTLLDGYKRIDTIGFREFYHQSTDKSNYDQLFKCTSLQYPEVFEDLIITGRHSILVDDYLSDIQKEDSKKVNEGIYLTDNKYRLPACIDNRTVVYENSGKHIIYHLALENDNNDMNYGIFANGLLVETTSIRDLREQSNMTLIE